MMHILTVDDDSEIRLLLETYLGEEGYRVTTLPDGREVLDIIERDPVDLVLLDVNMPYEDGLAVMQKIRAKCAVPIIMLTGKSEQIDKVLGLEVGADDYICKPFDLRELLARVKAVLRRVNLESTAIHRKSRSMLHVSFSGWEFNIDKRELLSPDGNQVKLTNNEHNLLCAFIENAQHVLSRDQLLEFSRKRPDEVFDRSIDYTIMQLRKKIEPDPKIPELIKTEHGVGYKFMSDVTIK